MELDFGDSFIVDGEAFPPGRYLLDEGPTHFRRPMTPSLAGRIAAALAAPVAEPVRAFAERLAQAAGARAALFYGSNLRTGALDGVLDFYLLLDGGLSAASGRG